MNLALVLDGAIALLLVATIGYAAVLNRRLTALRRTRSEMEALVGQFSEVAERAQSGLAEVQRAASQSGETLEKHLGEARGLADDLAFMVEKGNGLADRLDNQISAAREQSARSGPSVVEPEWAKKADKRGVLVDRDEAPDAAAGPGVRTEPANGSPSQPAEMAEPGPHAAALASAARAARDAVSEVTRKSKPPRRSKEAPQSGQVAATGTNGPRPHGPRPAVAANAPGSAAPAEAADDAPLMQILRRVR